MFWLIGVYAKMEIKVGPVFQKAGKVTGMIRRAQIGDLDPLFHSVLKRVQLNWPSIIPDLVNVENEMSGFRSIRRGSTSQAQNAWLPKEVIKANNCWWKALKSRGLRPGSL